MSRSIPWPLSIHRALAVSAQGRGMKTLYIGSAPRQHIEAALASHGEGGDIIVYARNAEEYAVSAKLRYELHGRITLADWRLWRILLAHRPGAVCIVVGDKYWHENIVHAVKVLGDLLFLGCTISIIQRHATVSVEPVPRYFSLLWHAFFFLSVMALLAAVCATGPVSASVFLGAIVLAELLHKTMCLTRSKESSPSQEYFKTLPVETYDGILGWRLNQGIHGHGYIEDRAVGERLEYSYTHDADGHRTTGTTCREKEGAVLTIGCSFTYGAYLNDEETYPYLLQCENNDWNVVNLGVCGYSLLQMYMQLKSASKTYKPKAVILGFHGGLANRTVMTYDRMKKWYPTKIPSLDIKKQKVLPLNGYCSIHFSNHSFILKSCEVVINKYRLRVADEKRIGRLHTELLLKSIRDLCHKSGAALLVACLQDSEHYYKFLSHSFNWCICLSEDYMRRSRHHFKLLPLNHHPDAAANVIYSDVVSSALRHLLAHGRYQPPVEEYYKYLSTSSGSARDEGVSEFVYPLY